jgi:hypothetical protein
VRFENLGIYLDNTSCHVEGAAVNLSQKESNILNWEGIYTYK